MENFVTLTAVIGSIGIDSLDATFDLLEEFGQASWINDIFARDESR